MLCSEPLGGASTARSSRLIVEGLDAAVVQQRECWEEAHRADGADHAEEAAARVAAHAL